MGSRVANPGTFFSLTSFLLTTKLTAMVLHYAAPTPPGPPYSWDPPTPMPLTAPYTLMPSSSLLPVFTSVVPLPLCLSTELPKAYLQLRSIIGSLGHSSSTNLRERSLQGAALQVLLLCSVCESFNKVAAAYCFYWCLKFFFLILLTAIFSLIF